MSHILFRSFFPHPNPNILLIYKIIDKNYNFILNIMLKYSYKYSLYLFHLLKEPKRYYSYQTEILPAYGSILYLSKISLLISNRVLEIYKFKVADKIYKLGFLKFLNSLITLFNS